MEAEMLRTRQIKNSGRVIERKKHRNRGIKKQREEKT
jgi:hypothetical protein